jgi:hypothetical protein
MSIQDLDSDIETAMNEIAGNWREFKCFIWDNEPEENSEDYAIVYLSNRDSGDLAKSNEHAILESLAEADPEGNDYHEERHSHWGPGYVNGIVIRVRRDGKPTPAFVALHECAMSLANYPVLDDEDFNKRETESANEAWSNYGASDFRTALASLPDCMHENAFFDAVPDHILRIAWEALNPSGEWVIHESSGSWFSFDSRLGKRAGACRLSWRACRAALLDAIFEHTRRSTCHHAMPMSKGATWHCCVCGDSGCWERGETVIPDWPPVRFDGNPETHPGITKFDGKAEEK